METYVLDRMKSSQVRTCSYGRHRLRDIGIYKHYAIDTAVRPEPIGRQGIVCDGDISKRVACAAGIGTFINLDSVTLPTCILVV